MKKVIVFALAMLVGQSVAAAGSQILPDENTVIGKVDGTEVKLGDIQNKKIHDLRQELFKEIENAFVTESINRLKKGNEGFGEITLPPMDEKEVRKFYDDNGLARRGSYEMLAPQIKEYLTGMLKSRIEYNLYKMAEDNGKVSSNLVDPGVFTVKIPVETAFIQGNEKANVMVLEFSDFQCPYCRKVQPTLKELRARYGDKVAFGYRHMPLGFHQEADESAIAAECARDQGKFVEMHNSLYEQQTSQSIADLKNLAKKIGIADLKKFDACLDKEKYRTRVERDMQVASSVGITGTPAFIIGSYDSKSGQLEGEIIPGAMPLQGFIQTLDKYLTAKAK